MLRLPVVSGACFDLAAADGCELPALCLHHLVLGDVLNGLQNITVIPSGPKLSSKPYLSKAASGSLDGDFALIVNGGPDVDGLSRDVSSPVQPDPAGDGARGEAGHAQLVFYLAVEGLLNNYNILFPVNYTLEESSNLGSIYKFLPP